MDINELIAEIVSSRKYASVSREVIERTCIEASKKYKKKKEVLSEAKKQLHIIYESFLTKNCQSIARKKIENYSGEDMANDKSFSKELLSLHVSTKERLASVDETYDFIAQYITQDCILSDVGCGFNPLALPFLSNKPSRYLAYEISQETVELINLYFARVGIDNYRAELLDAVIFSPPGHCDLLLAFKLLPLLQQQKKGRVIEFLVSTSFEKAIVSFPIKSLSGKNKGMESFYSSFIESNLPMQITINDRKVINNELFYVLRK